MFSNATSIFRWFMPAMTLTPFACSIMTSGNALAAAFLDPVAAPSGAYINGSRPERSSKESYDEERERDLWEALALLAANKTDGSAS
jgi:hypothetical protein